MVRALPLDIMARRLWRVPTESLIKATIAKISLHGNICKSSFKEFYLKINLPSLIKFKRRNP